MSPGAPSHSHRARTPWWVGHPIVKYPGFAVLGVGAGSRLFLEGDAEVIGISAAFVILGPVSMVAGVLLLRGTIKPTKHPGARRVSPITVVLAGLGFTVASAAMLVDVLVAPTERWAPVLIAAWCTAGLVAASLFVEAVSRTESWPDRWRAPYQRRGVMTADPSVSASSRTSSDDSVAVTAGDPAASDPPAAGRSPATPSPERAADAATDDQGSSPR